MTTCILDPSLCMRTRTAALARYHATAPPHPRLPSPSPPPPPPEPGASSRFRVCKCASLRLFPPAPPDVFTRIAPAQSSGVKLCSSGVSSPSVPVLVPAHCTVHALPFYRHEHRTRHKAAVLQETHAPRTRAVSRREWEWDAPFVRRRSRGRGSRSQCACVRACCSILFSFPVLQVTARCCWIVLYAHPPLCVAHSAFVPRTPQR